MGKRKVFTGTEESPQTAQITPRTSPIRSEYKKPRVSPNLDGRGESAGLMILGTRRATNSWSRAGHQLGTWVMKRISGSSLGFSHRERSTEKMYRLSSTMNSGSIALHTPVTLFCLKERIFK